MRLSPSLHRALVVLAALILAGPGAGSAEPVATDRAAPAEQVRQTDGAPMVLVPGGAFRMGMARGEVAIARGLARRFGAEPDAQEFEAEVPAHQVDLPAFWIDRLEVTNARYALFVEATRHPAPASSVGPEYNVWEAGAFPEHLRDHPVVNVTWDDAVAYCAWAGARLPTEAEWEKAARGTDGRMFPWGAVWDEGRANRGRWDVEKQKPRGEGLDGHLNTAPVGSFPMGAGPYGAEDQAGNVMEWVADRYGAGYYAVSPPSSPRGPAEADERVARGGSWYYDPVHMRTTHRHHLAPDTANSNLGFRCARAAEGATSSSGGG